MRIDRQIKEINKLLSRFDDNCTPELLITRMRKRFILSLFEQGVSIEVIKKALDEADEVLMNETLERKESKD